MSFEWRPRHSEHAIEVMSLGIAFPEPLPVRLSQRLQQSVFSRMTADGDSIDRKVIRGIQVTNGAASFEQVGVQLSVPAEGHFAASTKLSSQVEINPQAIIYRTWAYEKWDAELARMRAWMAEAIDLAASVSSIQSARLEYQDRFSYDGDVEDAPVAQLLRSDCMWLAPHIFSLREGWHSHTGRFIPSTHGQRSVVQLHVDVQDLPFPSPPGVRQTRWIYMMTAFEDRYDFTEIDPDGLNADFLFERSTAMHHKLDDIIKQALTDEACAAINLT